MYRRRTNRSRGGFIVLALLIVAIIGAGAYWWVQAGGELPRLPRLSGGVEGEVASGTSDINGIAHVDARSASSAGSVDFQVLSGLTGERLPGVTVSIAVIGSQRLMYAEDPSGLHVPVASPMTGESTVRRLIMPPRGALSYNITTAVGGLDLDRLEKIGTLNEADLRNTLDDVGERAVLIYLYNPMSPLALTGAGLDVYATPYPNVFVLKPGVDDPGMTSMVLVGMNDDAFESWGHIAVDRYLSGRVGQVAAIDLGSDLSFAWAYPVFDVFPGEGALDLGGGDTVTLRISWRSQNPDPPPPWSFFISTSDTEEGRVTISPENFPLSPEMPPQEVTITINRVGLAVGEHAVKIFIQPFSESFGMIDQRVEREITFTVAVAQPTPTAGPSVEGLDYAPLAPKEGDILTVTAGGFTPGEAVLVDFIGPEKTISNTQPVAQADGSFEYQIDLTGAPPGTYTLSLRGSQSGVSGMTQVVVGAGVADAIVNTGELNLRTQPSFDAPVLEVLVRGDELTIISVNGDDTWYEVVTKTGVQGWVDAKLIKLNIDPATVPWNPAYPAPS